MPDSKFDLGDYIEVKDRIARLYEYFPQARIETDYALTREPDDKPKVIARAFVYRKPDDEKPAGHGTSWLYLPGATSYTKGSEVENAETSAVGRAIGMLGILIEKSVASANEIRAKAGESDTNGGLIGTVVKQKARTTDFLLRELADGGAHIGFRLASGAGPGVICEARDDLARALPALEADIIGQRVQVWGAFVQYGPEQGVQHPYRAFRVSRIATPSGTIPAAEGEPGAAPEAQVAEAGEATGADSSKDAPTDAAGHSPEAAGGGVTAVTAKPSPPAEADAEDLAKWQREHPSLALLPDDDAA